MKLRCIARCNDGSTNLVELESLYEHDKEIKFKTFAKYVDISALSEYLGYVLGRHARGLRLKNDWHVRFYKSKFRGTICYHLVWSEIDHIFQ